MTHSEIEKSNSGPVQGPPGLLTQARASLNARRASPNVVSSQRVAEGRGQPPPATPEDGTPRSSKTTNPKNATIDLEEVKTAKALIETIQNTLQTPGDALPANLPDVLKALKTAENFYTTLLEGQCTNSCSLGL